MIWQGTREREMCYHLYSDKRNSYSPALWCDMADFHFFSRALSSKGWKILCSLKCCVKWRKSISRGMGFFLSFSPSPFSTFYFISWLHAPYLVNVFQTLQPWSSTFWHWLKPMEFSRHWFKAPASDPAVGRDPQSHGWGEESLKAK